MPHMKRDTSGKRLTRDSHNKRLMSGGRNSGPSKTKEAAEWIAIQMSQVETQLSVMFPGYNRQSMNWMLTNLLMEGFKYALIIIAQTRLEFPTIRAIVEEIKGRNW